MSTKRTPHYAGDYTTLSGYGLKLLKRQGFKVGCGLGKNLNGIKETISIKKRKENLGLGAEGKKFQNFWWEKLMEKTLSGKNKEEKVIESKSNSVLAREIETTKLYGGSFVRASSKSMNHFNKQIFQKESAKEEQKEEEKTTVSDSESSSEEEVKTIVTEKLFLECGKRTLKKYRQKGKHNRLKKQDEEMMKKLKQSEKKRKLSDSDSICDDQSSKKKKKK